jgi:hypothetical protein
MLAFMGRRREIVAPNFWRRRVKLFIPVSVERLCGEFSGDIRGLLLASNSET